MLGRLFKQTSNEVPVDDKGFPLNSFARSFIGETIGYDSPSGSMTRNILVKHNNKLYTFQVPVIRDDAEIKQLPSNNVHDYIHLYPYPEE